MKLGSTAAIALSLIANAANAETTIARNLPEIVDLTPEDRIDLDVSQESKTVQCAVKAVNESKLPNAGLTVEKREMQYYDGKTSSEYNISKSKEALFPKEDAEGTTLNYEKPNAIEIPGYTIHNISLGITLNSEKTRISFEAYHNGSYNSTVDAANADIVAEVTATGLTNRAGGAIQHSEAFKERTDPSTTAHGQWTITAVQALEHRFDLCMGFESANRPATAATVEQSTPYKMGVPQASIPQLNRAP